MCEFELDLIAKSSPPEPYAALMKIWNSSIESRAAASKAKEPSKQCNKEMARHVIEKNKGARQVLLKKHGLVIRSSQYGTSLLHSILGKMISVSDGTGPESCFAIATGSHSRLIAQVAPNGHSYRHIEVGCTFDGLGGLGGFGGV